MRKVYYVECPTCHKEYYLQKMLYDAAIENPKQKLKCPFCKREFLAEETDLKK